MKKKILILCMCMTLIVTGCGKEDKKLNDDINYNDYIQNEKKDKKITFEDSSCKKLNGNIKSLINTGTYFIIMTKDNELYMLSNFNVDYIEEKCSKITTASNMKELKFNEGNIIYGKNNIMNFDMTTDYTDYSTKFLIKDNIQITNDKSLILATNDLNTYAYVDENNNVFIKHRKDENQPYSTYAGDFEDSNGMKINVVPNKTIYNFVLTNDNKLLFLRPSVRYSYGNEIPFILYNDFTDKIQSNVISLFDAMSTSRGCYVVDENNNIYYIEVPTTDAVVKKISSNVKGNIIDVIGFGGKPENILIKIDNDFYYNNNGSLEKVENTSGLSNVTMLLDNNVIGLKDGYLNTIEFK